MRSNGKWLHQLSLLKICWENGETTMMMSGEQSLLPISLPVHTYEYYDEITETTEEMRCKIAGLSMLPKSLLEK